MLSLKSIRGQGLGDDASDTKLIWLYNILQICGILVLVPTLATAYWSTRIRRSATWFTFIFSWALGAVVNVLIIGQQTGSPPNSIICTIQVSLLYPALVFSATSGVALLFNIYLTVAGILSQRLTISNRYKYLLHVIPAVVSCGVLVESLTLSILHPEEVNRNESGMFCHIASGPTTTINVAIVSFCMLSMLVLEATTVVLLSRNWRSFRSQEGTSVTILVRFGIFTVVVLFCLAITLVVGLPGSSNGNVVNVVIASLPLAAGLILGVQRDILRVWMFWQKPPRVHLDSSDNLHPSTELNKV